ncbi:MAG: hypothetical protein ACR2KV_00160 [Solirubrobacteraceae bacterium]
MRALLRSRSSREALKPAPARDEAVGPDTFEWRMRECDGPVDLGHYGCACGYQFAARVATTVRCPHCGAEQAW